MAERRQDARQPSYLGGKIVYNNRLSTVDCVIRNMSSDGFRLTFANTVFVPDEFELQIPQRGASYQVRVSWRKFGEIGATLVATQAPAPGDDQKRLRKLEKENADLRRRMADLDSLDPPR